MVYRGMVRCPLQTTFSQYGCGTSRVDCGVRASGTPKEVVTDAGNVLLTLDVFGTQDSDVFTP